MGYGKKWKVENDLKQILSLPEREDDVGDILETERVGET